MGPKHVGDGAFVCVNRRAVAIGVIGEGLVKTRGFRLEILPLERSRDGLKTVYFRGDADV